MEGVVKTPPIDPELAEGGLVVRGPRGFEAGTGTKPTAKTTNRQAGWRGPRSPSISSWRR